MAVLYVSEFSALYQSANGQGAMAVQPSLRDQTIAIGSGSTTPTYPFLPATRFVRLHADAICSVAFGTSPTASATNARMAANQTEYFAVAANTNQTVAVITNT